MLINDFHIQLATAYPGAKQVRSSKGSTLKAEIATDEGRKNAYVKLLSIEDIAREAICAVLARKLHLPMLQPYYVNVDPTVIEDHQAGNIHKIAFGVEADETPAFRITNSLSEGDILGWEEALRLAVFDEWIYNRDRVPNNLIFAGKGHFLLIDHDEALPNYASPTTCSSAQLLQLFAKNRSEFELYEIRRRAMEYVEEYLLIDWVEIYAFLSPENLPGSTQLFEKHIAFLSARRENMRGMIGQSLGIKQKELNFPTPNKMIKDKK